MPSWVRHLQGYRELNADLLNAKSSSQLPWLLKWTHYSRHTKVNSATLLEDLEREFNLSISVGIRIVTNSPMTGQGRNSAVASRQFSLTSPSSSFSYQWVVTDLSFDTYKKRRKRKVYESFQDLKKKRDWYLTVQRNQCHSNCPCTEWFLENTAPLSAAYFVSFLSIGLCCFGGVDTHILHFREDNKYHISLSPLLPPRHSIRTYLNILSHMSSF